MAKAKQSPKEGTKCQNTSRPYIKYTDIFCIVCIIDNLSA